jgi:hypothetical protein
MSSFPAIRQFTIIMLMFVWFVFELSTTAQEDDITAWTIEESCIAAPSAMPDDWAYSGTILMSGYAGIHGVRMEWETPHVVAFFRSHSKGDAPMIGGQISPDGRWYALPFGETYLEFSYNYYFFVHGWRVYSTSDDQQVLEFSLGDQDFYCYICSVTAWEYLPIEWIDNESLVIGGILSRPFENRVEVAAFNSALSSLSNRFLSPDKIYAYLFNYGLYELSAPQETLKTLGDVNGVSWRRDSLGFIANLHNERQDWNGLVYYERDGTLIDYIFNAGDRLITFERDASGRNELRWSPNNDYFAYIDDSYTEPSRLYILDFERKIVIDTCLSPLTHPVWSPDGNMLAYVTLARENLKVVVVDLEKWQAFDVARHSGSTTVEMVGWRADD